MWLGLLGRSTYPQLALTRTFVAILKSRKAVKQEKRGKRRLVPQQVGPASPQAFY